MSEESSAAAAAITVQLVDPNDGRQLQVWSFMETDSITIGRGDDQCVTLADPYVSRQHAELRRDAAGWRVIAHGRNGVFVGGASVSNVLLEAGTSFRLGPTGPALRYQTQVESSGGATLSFDPESMIVLQMNRGQLEEQTREVIETDYFQKLQQTARSLRQRRQSAEDPPTG
ncbi:MAG TPA: FHA domain-containing protein [Planctomycetaceae bacterium]|nr:FHA domain-containing protein [Planctomycetaceae bacterium]